MVQFFMPDIAQFFVSLDSQGYLRRKCATFRGNLTFLENLSQEKDIRFNFVLSICLLHSENCEWSIVLKATYHHIIETPMF